MKIFTLLLLFVAPVSAGQFGTNFLSQYRISATHFNEGTGTTSQSIGSSASDWTAITGWVDGLFGKGMLMVNTSAPVSTVVVGMTTGFWAHGWIRNTSVYTTVIFFTMTNATECCILTLKDPNSLGGGIHPNIGCYSAGWSWWYSFSDVLLTDGKWHMVDYYKGPSNDINAQYWTMYIDGVKQNTILMTKAIYGNTTGMSLSGERCGGAGTASIVGAVDDFQLFKLPLPVIDSQVGSWIKKMYTAGLGRHSND